MTFERNNLVNLIKDAGQELINGADDIVGQGNYISDLTIYIRIPADSTPTIEIDCEHVRPWAPGRHEIINTIWPE